jgi:hypothetical protein
MAGGMRPSGAHVEENQMAKAKSKIAPAKTSEQRAGNRYTPVARVLAKDDTIDVKTLADSAFMSESTAARCLKAWRACVAALVEVGRLADPAKATQKKAARKPKPVPVAKPAATETTAAPDETVGTTAI